MSGLAAALAGIATCAILPAPGAGATQGSPAADQIRAAAFSDGPITAAASAPVSFERAYVTSVAAPKAPVKKPRAVAAASSSAPQVAKDSAAIASVPAAGVAHQTAPSAAQGAPNSRLAAPLAAPVKTSAFGFRQNPLTGAADEMHYGSDYGAACGTPVLASAVGVVKAAGWHPFGGGNRVEIEHGGGLVTTYNHLAGIEVAVGQQVGPGERVATVGTTGNSTGCHLHFEVLQDGAHVDPEGWL